MGIYGSMKNLQHPWNLSIPQKVLKGEKNKLFSIFQCSAH